MKQKILTIPKKNCFKRVDNESLWWYIKRMENEAKFMNLSILDTDPNLIALEIKKMPQVLRAIMLLALLPGIEDEFQEKAKSLIVDSAILFKDL